MTRDEILKIIGEDADKEIVNNLLDAMHAEIKVHKDTADTYKKQAEEAASKAEKAEREMQKAVLDKEDAIKAKDTEIKSLTDKVTKADENAQQLTKKMAEDAESYKHQIDDWSAKYDTDLKAAKDALSKSEFDRVVDNAILTSRPRNAKAVSFIRGSLDMDALRNSEHRDEDIAAAIKAVHDAEETAFLFESSEPKPTGEHTDIGAPTKTHHEPDYSKMNDDDYYASMMKNERND